MFTSLLFTAFEVFSSLARRSGGTCSGGGRLESWGAECSCIVVTCAVREVHSEHALHALLLGGSGGMPPPGKF